MTHIPRKSSRSPRHPLIARTGALVNLCAGTPTLRSLLELSLALLALGCDPATDPGPGQGAKCALAADSTPPSSPVLACPDDYQALANRPLDQSIPGAYSVKTVIDRADGDRLYFLDTRKYRVHYEFAAEHLSGNGRPLVPSISDFGQTEYYTPHRRFILGSLSRYEPAGLWVWEMTPSDNAGAEMIASAYRKVAEACFCGKDLYFHATSLAIEAEARNLPASVKVITTAEVLGGTDYQALAYGTAFGRVVFPAAGQAETPSPGPRDIVVLDAAPDDLPLVAGIITQGFQTPLSHLNVLAQDRGTPNLGLRGARSHRDLRALEGRWARLTVVPAGWSATEATESEADAWWEGRQPVAAPAPGLDTAEKDLKDVETLLDLGNRPLGEALRKAIAAYGGRTSHYAALPHMDTAKVRCGKALGVPIHYYLQHLRQSGLHDTVQAMLADPLFQADPSERQRRLASLRAAIVAAPVDTAFWKRLNDALDARFPKVGTLTFHPSSNAADLEGATGAGLYASRTGGKPADAFPLRQALLEVWAGAWDFRAFEERRGRGIDPRSVGMGVLVKADAPGASANGLAVTANPFDPPGYEPGFYVNVRAGAASVARPGPTAAMDQFIYHYDIAGRPIVMLARANPSPGGTSVLTPPQTAALGDALKAIHLFFHPWYGSRPTAWYGMEVDFELSPAAGASPGAEPVIRVRQVRPYRGWGKP